MTTKDYIADTALGMLRNISLDKLTIKDIVEQCGITRQTFYYHFSDIMDMFRWVVQRDAGRLVTEAYAQHDIEAALHMLAVFVDNNESVIPMLMNTKYHDAVDETLYSAAYGLLESLAASVSDDSLDSNRSEYSFLCSYNAYAVKDMLLYGRKSLKLDTDALVSRIHKLILDEFGALNKKK